MSILEQDPKGRADIAVLRMAEMIVRGPVEKLCNGLPLWDAGLGQICEAIVTEQFPAKPIDPVEVARELGLVRRGVPANRPPKSGRGTTGQRGTTNRGRYAHVR